MKIIFIGNPIDESDYKKLKNKRYISFADNRVQLSMIKGLNLKYNKDFITITVNRVNNFKKIENSNTKYVSCNTKNPIWYYCSILKNIFFELKKILKNSNKEKVIIITNGPYIYYSLPVILLKKRFKITYIPFLICAVELPEYKGIFKIVSKLSKYLIKKADGSITYVANSSLDYTNKPYIDILPPLEEEKIVSSSKLIEKEKGSIYFLFSGAFELKNGILILLKVFKELPSNYKLILCGDGSEVEYVKDVINSMPKKFIYLGTLDHKVILNLQRNVDYLISIRSNEGKVYKYYSKYAFSSKLVEYLNSGVPVIVNKIPSIPKSLEKYYYYVDDSNLENLSKSIIDIVNGKKDDRSKKGMEHVRKYANESYQNKLIFDFLDKYLEGKL